MLYRFCLTLCCVAVLFASNSRCPAQKPLAIKNATILTGTGDRIENGSIVIQDGKITDIGTDVEIPVAASVIDATGKVVMPGLVEAHTAEGQSQSNETNPNVPYLSVIDGIDPVSSYFQQARRNGVTSARIAPGNSTMIGGQAAIVKTGGMFVEDMVVERVAGVKISLRPVSGSRMAHLSKLRKALNDARKKLNEKEEDKKDEGEEKKDDSKEESDDGDEAEDEKDDEGSDDEDKEDGSGVESELTKAMKSLLSGKYSAIIYCDKAMDVGQALRLIEEFDLKATLVLGPDCYKAAEQVAKSGLPVILDSNLVFWEEDPRTKEEEKIVLTKVFSDAGVDYVFQTSRVGSATLGTNYLWYQAATAVKYGMPKEKAIESLTSLPAKFLNIDEFVGSLEKGKDGDLVILSGDPLQVDTWVEKTIINGEVVYEKETDDQLRRLLTGEEDTE